MPGPRLAFAVLCALSGAHHAPALAQSNAAPALAQRIDIAAHVREAAQRFGIPEHWIYAVIRIESAGRIRAVSSAGAIGLMQLMPGTWARQRDRYELGSDPYDARDNIIAGTSYLREMYDRYGAAGFLAAYNAGPGRYEDWLAGRRALPLETRRYVARITPLLQPGRILAAAAPQPARTLPAALPRPAGPILPVGEAAEPGAPANPFASPSVPAHDLFAPVLRVGDR